MVLLPSVTGHNCQMCAPEFIGIQCLIEEDYSICLFVIFIQYVYKH